MYFSTAFFNGSFLDHEEVFFPMEERGLHFGDGIYEVIRLYKGAFYLLDDHIERLFRSAREIALPLSWSKQEYKSMLQELVQKNDCTVDAMLYMQITRGSFPRDHVFPKQSVPNTVAYLKPMERPVEKLEEGVSVLLVPDIRWHRCDIKSLNLLPNVLAKQEAFEKGCFEAIQHRDGVVTEGSASNFFIVKNKKVYTHPSTNFILNGITRMNVFKLCKENNIEIEEQPFTIEDVYAAEESFLTSTISEVMPIVKVDKVELPIGSVTRKLQEGFINEIKG